MVTWAGSDAPHQIPNSDRIRPLTWNPLRNRTVDLLLTMAIRGLSDQAICNLKDCFYLQVYGSRSPDIAERGWLIAPKNGPHFWYPTLMAARRGWSEDGIFFERIVPCHDCQRHQRCQDRS